MKTSCVLIVSMAVSEAAASTCNGNYQGSGSGRYCDWWDNDGTYRNGCGTDPINACEEFCTTNIGTGGCNHGSPDNTCGFNSEGRCVYANPATAETDVQVDVGATLAAETDAQYYICSAGKYDWKHADNHRDCAGGCDYNTCESQLSSGLARNHCYTQAQIDAGRTGLPEGCERPGDDGPWGHGYWANTCAIDAAGRCVYSDIDQVDDGATLAEETQLTICPGFESSYADGGADCGQGEGGGCSWQICEDQINAVPKLANYHCYTQAQINAGNTGKPLGCQRPPDASNTCAEVNGYCQYAQSGLSI